MINVFLNLSQFKLKTFKIGKLKIQLKIFLSNAN